MKKKISFEFKHGKVDGIYIRATDPNAPLVIITNGHNGFYSYGMFPYIQEKLFEDGISSYSYNFSHGGVLGDANYFSDLKSYEQNCMRLETEDLCEIVRNLKNSEIHFSEKNMLFLLAHSLGGAPTIFAANKLLAEGYPIEGLILVSTVKTIARWGKAAMEEWERNGVYYIKNNRTKQDLPQGKEFLEEIKEANGKWSIQKALSGLRTKILIVHCEKDEAVSVDDSTVLRDWSIQGGNKTDLHVIANGTHTFGTKHPFSGTTPELDSLIKVVREWIKNKLEVPSDEFRAII